MLVFCFVLFFSLLSLFLVFSKTYVFLQRFQLELLATWGWNSQADIAIDNITFGLDCLIDGEPQMLQNLPKNVDSVISIPQIQDTHSVLCTECAWIICVSFFSTMSFYLKPTEDC